MSTSTTFDLIIIGGGPAGTAAAVYAARKQLKTLLILKEWGGQSIVSDDVQNWIDQVEPHQISPSPCGPEEYPASPRSPARARGTH